MKYTTEELKRLVEQATKGADWTSRVAFDKLRDNLLDNTADLIRCRELLAELFKEYCSQMSSEYDYPGRPWTPERDNDTVAIEAKNYLSETEG